MERQRAAECAPTGRRNGFHENDALMGLRRGLSKTFQPSHPAFPVLKGLFKDLRFGNPTRYRRSTQSFLCTDRDPSFVRLSHRPFGRVGNRSLGLAFSDGWGGFAVAWNRASWVLTPTQGLHITGKLYGRRRRGSRPVALQLVPFHQAVKRGAINARAPRGLRQVAAGLRDRARQELPIELLEELIPGIVIAVVRSPPRAGRVLEAETAVAGRGRYTKERDVCGVDLRRWLQQHDRVLDDVLQLAHVARPWMRL